MVISMNEQIKKLSSILRHTAASQGLSVSAAGWVPTYQIMECMDIRASELRKLVSQDTKGRLELNRSMIRCGYGHSTEMPVVVESLEASWTPYAATENLWYGTNLDYLAIIAELGVRSSKRTHVSLTVEKESPLWKNRRIAVILEVSARILEKKKIELFQASNGVILTRSIPEICIIKAHLRDERSLATPALKFIPSKWK